MNAALAIGVQSYQAAFASFSQAASRVHASVHASAIPSAPSPTVARTPGAPATSPTIPLQVGGRALSSSENDLVSGMVGLITARQDAEASAMIVRAADAMLAQRLDARA